MQSYHFLHGNVFALDEEPVSVLSENHRRPVVKDNLLGGANPLSWPDEAGTFSLRKRVFQEQDLQSAPGFPPRIKAGGKNPGVVDNQEIILPQKPRKKVKGQLRKP